MEGRMWTCNVHIVGAAEEPGLSSTASVSNPLYIIPTSTLNCSPLTTLNVMCGFVCEGCYSHHVQLGDGLGTCSICLEFMGCIYGVLYNPEAVHS